VSDVFISYRHGSPDQGLALALRDYLAKRGLKVFLDVDIPPGKIWAKRIRAELRDARFFIVLLSQRSICSDMVREEVRIAHQRRKTILPIRFADLRELPYDLGSWLNPIQYGRWNPTNPRAAVCSRIYRAIHAGTPLPEAGGKTPVTLKKSKERDDAPLPAADPRIVMEAGAVRLDSPFYVKRPEDSTMERELALKGRTITVKGPRQSGKSSLVARAHAWAVKNGRQSCYIDFQTIDSAHLKTLGALLRNLAHIIAADISTSLKPDDVWEAAVGHIRSANKFIGQGVLGPATAPVVFCFDEVDRVFSLPYRDDFFGALRAWHNQRATNPGVDPMWEKLTLVLAHSTAPALWIKDLNQSPFNVAAARLELGDLTRSRSGS